MAHFSVSPEVLGPLGIDQLQDPALAVLELVKNSWDADASVVRVRIDEKNDSITVEDDGVGMSKEEFSTHWLLIGHSNKRNRQRTARSRTLVGEKGLGRIAAASLGNKLQVDSRPPKGDGVFALVSWPELATARSVESYEFDLLPSKRKAHGTTVAIKSLRGAWTEAHTRLLVTHLRFLVFGQHKFRVSLSVNGSRRATRVAHLPEGIFSAKLKVEIQDGGTPRVAEATVDGRDFLGIQFGGFREKDVDARLAGTQITLGFFRRDGVLRPEFKTDTDVLKEYAGVRVFRGDVNVPPYGLEGDDWAGLERQRTSTGGPTLVPGNSQLFGAVVLDQSKQTHLRITAGRSGFSDQNALDRLRQYVRWAVRELGRIRRANHFNQFVGEVPHRTDVDARDTRVDAGTIRHLIRSGRGEVQSHQKALLELLAEIPRLLEHLQTNEENLRTFSQIASTGLAATSFIHELKTKFDVISFCLDELKDVVPAAERQLLRDLEQSWARVLAFAGLFKLLPVRRRRKSQKVSHHQLVASMEAILALADPEKVHATVHVPADFEAKLVPAEVDAIVLNLVTNALKAIAASKNRDAGRVRIRVVQDGRRVQVQVEDNGIGFPAGRPIGFSIGAGDFEEGTGMGLPIVRYLAEKYAGDVKAEIARAPFTSMIVVRLEAGGSDD